MATGYSNVWSNGWASLRIFYSSSYDPSTNRSTVTITPQLKSAYNYGTDYRLYDAIYNNTAGIYGNGTKLFALGPISGSTYLSCGSATNTWASFNRSFSFTVSHNASGDASFTVGVLGSVRHYYNGGATVSPVGSTASGTITIHENAASSIASSTSAAATQSAYSLTMNRSLPTNTHVAVFRCGEDTLYTSELFETSLHFTIPRGWFADYPDLAVLSVTVSVQTYSGNGTALGSPVTAALTVTADALMRPKLSDGWVSLSPYNSGAVSGFTGYIRGYSRAEAVFDTAKIDMSDALGAAIASFSVSCQGESASEAPYRTPTLSATSVTVVCTVTDTRGRTASESFPLSVMDCAAPVLTGQNVFRCDSSGTADEDGTYISVSTLASFSALDGQNICTLSAAIADAGGSYGAETLLSSGGRLLLGPNSPDLSYTVRLRAVDSLGSTAVYYASVPTRKWAMKFRPNGAGVAFGKAAEHDNTFEIDSSWAVKSRGIVDLIYPVGSLYLSVSGTSPATLFGGTWQRIEDTFLLAAGQTYAAGGTGGSASHTHTTGDHTLVVNEIPSHTHGIKGWRYGHNQKYDNYSASYTQLSDAASSSTPILATGGGKPHNHGDTGSASNLPPYLAVYIWKRTA